MNTNRLITIDQLPAEISVDIPKDSYSIILKVLMYAGMGIAAIGVLFIIFGPERIYYNTREGMTFIQYLQAYPGPIASVGGLLVFVAGQISNFTAQKMDKTVNEQLFSKIDIKDSDIPEGFILNMKPADEKGKVLVELVKSEEPMETVPVK